VSERLLRDLLSRRDPHGYYVIPARPEARSIVEGLAGGEAIIVDAADVILVKVRSRSTASKILRVLNRKGLIALGDRDLEEYEEEDRERYGEDL
jgi:hypothetical protein